ncbi:MAG: alkaline phosphatase family protein, partial [Pseudonocardiaceae bacterium]
VNFDSRGREMPRSRAVIGLVAMLAVATVAVVSTGGATATTKLSGAERSVDTMTPIKHVVVIFQENVSFDHYFGTYPHATNPQGEPVFHAAPHTPAVNGLTPAVLNNNPNAANPAPVRPGRLHRRAAHGQSAGGVVPQGRQVPRRSPRLLRPTR